jgi:hypothetical protein
VRLPFLLLKVVDDDAATGVVFSNHHHRSLTWPQKAEKSKNTLIVLAISQEPKITKARCAIPGHISTNSILPPPQQPHRRRTPSTAK